MGITIDVVSETLLGPNSQYDNGHLLEQARLHPGALRAYSLTGISSSDVREFTNSIQNGKPLFQLPQISTSGSGVTSVGQARPRPPRALRARSLRPTAAPSSFVPSNGRPLRAWWRSPRAPRFTVGAGSCEPSLAWSDLA